MSATIPYVHLHPDDDVVIALAALIKGATLTQNNGSAFITLRQDIPAGHKIAVRDISAGEPVRRYNQVIGLASVPIQAGEHVHSHNLTVPEQGNGQARDYAFSSDVRPVTFVPAGERETFMGYRRENGRVGTRNTIVVISTVNCSAHVTRRIAERCRQELLPQFENVDDVVALTHKNGCGTRYDGPELDLLQRALAGFTRHPNVAGYVLVGLGCEINQMAHMIEHQGLIMPDEDRPLPPMVSIQDAGGIAAAIEEGVDKVAELLPRANSYKRTPQSVEHLIVGLECGGSDGWSGVTANPAVGIAADLLVAQGGTAVLSETPEIYGAEHLLTRRAISPEIGQKLVDRIRWWERYTEQHGFVIDNNPTPGNKAGGLTTIFEKSLGAVAKSGSSPLMDVVQYAQPIMTRGLVVMDTPGYDPVSVTGMAAGGANVIVFTTGRGSVFGFKPVPSIKVATNSAMYQHMEPDMDVNAGTILEGVPVEEVGKQIFDLIVRVASGEPSKSEAQGVGEEEFNPWIIGATM